MINSMIDNVIDDSDVAELQKIYCEMDAEGKKKVIIAATQLLSAQKNLEKKAANGDGHVSANPRDKND